jgi:tetratricopeptide (TPR) repeat protein
MPNPVHKTSFLVLSLVLLLPPAAPGAEKEKAAGTRYALLVGVRPYDPAELRSLPYTENDVRELAAVLKAGGYEKIRLMTHSAASDDARLLPTGANIRRELEQLVEDCSEEDTILVAFAGHGVQFKEGEENYFCPMDARLKDRKTLLSLDEVYSGLGKCKANCRLLLVDACRDDPTGAIDSRSAVADVASVTRPQKFVVPSGVTVLFSCSGGEKAYEDKDLKHGVFFYYVVQALGGAASAGDDEEVTLPRLEEFVTKKVREWADKHEKHQMPERKGASRGPFPLVRLVNRRALQHYGHAVDNYAGKKYKAALADLNQAIAANPNYVEAYLKRGYARYQLEDYDGAVADFRKVLDLNPAHASAYIGIGDVRYYGQDDPKRALLGYSRAIDLNPKAAAYYNRRGSAYYDTGGLDEARADYDKAIELDPRNAEAFYNRAWLWRKQGDLKKAFADIDKAVQIHPYENSYRQYRAALLEKRGDVKAALADYGKAIKVDPQDESAYYNRGNTYLRQGEYDSAIQNYNQVVQINNANTDAYYWRGYARQAGGDYQGAMADYDRVLRINPRHSGAQLFRTQASQRQFNGMSRDRTGGGILSSRQGRGGRN